MGNRTFGGKRAVVTGSSRGIGLAIAACLAEAGADVLIHGSSEASSAAFGGAATLTEAAAALAAQYGVEAASYACDVTDPAAVDGMARFARERFGAVDILVICAGGDIGTRGVRGPNAGKPAVNDALGISLEDQARVFDRNLFSCIYTCRSFALAMAERRSGSITAVGSIAGLCGIPQSVAYAVAKSGVHEYVRCLAAQLRPFNVRVNAVAPGDTVTDRFSASRALDPQRQGVAAGLGRYGRPEEIARAVAFLAGDDASYITGQILRADGGTQLWPA